MAKRKGPGGARRTGGRVTAPPPPPCPKRPNRKPCSYSCTYRSRKPGATEWEQEFRYCAWCFRTHPDDRRET